MSALLTAPRHHLYNGRSGRRRPSAGIRTAEGKIKAGANFQAPAIRYCMLMHAEAGVVAYAARFRTAHLFFIASLIRLRAAGDKWRLTLPFDWGGRPGPRFLPCKAEIAALRRSRSASNSSMIVAVSMLLLGDYECTHCTCATKLWVRTLL